MPITFHPRPGQILHCDFSQGFSAPEMVKSNRPVIVLSGPLAGRTDLVTVLPLSTKAPQKTMSYHYQLPKQCMPQLGRFQEKETWVKGDMIYTVGFHRLDLIRLGKRDPNSGKRLYFRQTLSRAQMREIYRCALYGLNLGSLAEYL